jgi:quercetin dioxygenase-like cupin family protein
MKLLAVTVLSPLLLASTYAYANQAAGASASDAASPRITIARGGSQPSGKGPSEYFSGSVRIGPLFQAKVPSRASGGRVTFEPGARTAWHTHPLGQILIVTSGAGWIQQWGGRKEEIREGDVVRIPPGQKHWHGATATTSMTHIAIQEELNGKAVEWRETVSDEQYRK